MPFFDFGAKRSEPSGTRLAHPGAPKGDTADLSPLEAICPPLLRMRDGSFVQMLELPPLPISVSGTEFSTWMTRYGAALAQLPAGMHFQLSVLPFPVHPEEDLAYFIEAARTWHTEAVLEKSSDRKRNASLALATASNHMTETLSGLYDAVRPMHWRWILTLVDRARALGEPKWGWGRKPKDGDFETHLRGAVARLEEQAAIFLQAFSAAGLPLVVLSPGQMAQALWLGLHPESTGLVQPDQVAKDLAYGKAPLMRTAPDEETFLSGAPSHSLAQLLVPDTVVERENSLEVDAVHLRGYILYDFKPFQPALLYRLTDLPGGWLGALYVEISDPQTASPQLDARQVQVDAGRLMRSSRGVLENFSAEMESAAVKESRARLAVSGQPPFLIRLFVFRSAPDQDTLEKRCRELESLLTTLGVRFYAARYRQRDLWQSTLPTGVMKVGQQGRNLTAESLTPFFWPPRARQTDPDGIYVGVDEDSGLPVRLDLLGSRAERTPSVLTLGRPGAGKSVTLRTAMLSGLIHGASVFALDLEGEMREFCRTYGGRYLEIGVSGGDRINILDIPPEQENPLAAGTEHLIAFCSAVRGADIPPGSEWNALAESYRLALVDRGWLGEDSQSTDRAVWDAQNAPRLRDIVRILERQGATGGSLAEMLRPYAEGVYASYFNHLTTFDLSKERLVVFGLQNVNLNDTAARLRVYLWQVMGLIWGEIVRRHAVDPRGMRMVMLDELWAILSAPGGAGAIENMARRFRKRRAVLWMATQQTGEFLDSPFGRRVLNIAGNTFLMEQRPAEARRLQQVFDLPDPITRLLEGTGTGRGVWMRPEGALRLRVIVPPAWGII